MFNVLPENFKNNIKREYIQRLLIVWFIVIVCMQGAFIASMFPSFIFLTLQEKDLIEENTKMTDDTTKQNAMYFTDLFKSTNRKLSIVSNNIKTKNSSDFISQIIALRGSSITCNEFIYVNDMASSSKLAISGVAKNREALLSFQKKIQSTSDFQDINLPVSNFVKDTNINFSLDFKTRL